MQAASHSNQTHPYENHTSDVFTRSGSEPPRSLQIATSLGSTIEARVYEPEGPILGNVLIHSATACPQRFYAPFARHLAQAGLRVVSQQLSGAGNSARSAPRPPSPLTRLPPAPSTRKSSAGS
jgi:hypothetical protein